MSSYGSGMHQLPMTNSHGTRWTGGVKVWTGVALFVFALTLPLSWATQRRVDALLDRGDARTLDESAQVLGDLVAQQRKHLTATLGVLAEDARIRAMVLTPTFDEATALDLLTDLRTTSEASVVALVDGGGVVRVAVGAPEMRQLNLGTSSLFKRALEAPSAQLWAFANKVGVLAAAPVRLDNQVRALFMMGFELDDALLERVQGSLGATGAVFLGDQIVASAGSAGETPSKTAELEAALRAAAALPPDTYGIVEGTFLASNSRLKDAPVATTVAWLVPLQRHDRDLRLTRALAWLPAAVASLMLACLIGLVLSQPRPGQSRGN